MICQTKGWNCALDNIQKFLYGLTVNGSAKHGFQKLSGEGNLDWIVKIGLLTFGKLW